MSAITKNFKGKLLQPIWKKYRREEGEYKEQEDLKENREDTEYCSFTYSYKYNLILIGFLLNFIKLKRKSTL